MMQTFMEIKNESYTKTQMSVYALCVLLVSLMFVSTAVRERYFELNFLVEMIFVFVSLRFYMISFVKKNYTFWGISFVFGLYLLKKILQFTFVDYSIIVLYLSFLSGIFLLVNCYMMSSPLFYPRIQWWEYDFRYRGDLKIEVDLGSDQIVAGRLSDIRRGVASIEIFEFVDLNSPVKIKPVYGQMNFFLSGSIQTIRPSIPGRPIRYGIKFQFSEKEDRKNYARLKNIWLMNNKVKIRRKFTEIKEKNG